MQPLMGKSMFGKRTTFGRRNSPEQDVASLRALANAERTPDDDGVRRIIPKEFWQVEQHGSLLRSAGLHYNDPKNIVKSAEYYEKIIAERGEAMLLRRATFAREQVAKHGYCEVLPFYIIPLQQLDDYSDLLLKSLELCGFDDWNILLCAADQETIDRCGMLEHPGEIPEMTADIIEGLEVYKSLFAQALDRLGKSALGHGSFSVEDFEAAKADIREKLLIFVAAHREQLIGIIRSVMEERAA